MFDYSDMITRPALFDMLQWLSTEAGCALVAAATVRHVPAGGTSYDQLEEGDEMFRLVSGSVRLSVICEEGRGLLYQLFWPGDCFGKNRWDCGGVQRQRGEGDEG